MLNIHTKKQFHKGGSPPLLQVFCKFFFSSLVNKFYLNFEIKNTGYLYFIILMNLLHTFAEFLTERRSYVDKNQRKRTTDTNINSSLAHNPLIRDGLGYLGYPCLYSYYNVFFLKYNPKGKHE